MICAVQTLRAVPEMWMNGCSTEPYLVLFILGLVEYTEFNGIKILSDKM